MSSTTTARPDEPRILSEECGLIDRPDRGKLALTGSGAIEFLNGQVTNELADLLPGQGRYAAFLNHKGGMLGDVRIVLAADPVEQGLPRLLLDTERACLQALFDMIRRFKVGYDVELHKRTLERGMVSLIGPASQRIADAGALAGEEHASVQVTLGSVRALAIRTPRGVDLLCDGGAGAELAEALLARGAQRVSEQAAECVRIEDGRPRFGIDIGEGVIPQEAGLNERAVSFTKGCYVGQETVARLFYKGKPNRHLRGLRLSRPGLAGEPLLLGERSVGALASTAVSPVLGPIALALVRREAQPGEELSLGQDARATVVELPFEGRA